jgi:hypothetical protein
MKQLALAFILCVALVGCSKKPAPAPKVAEQIEPPAPVAAPAPTRAPVPAAEEPVATKPKAPVSLEDQLVGTIHPEMTMRLQMFYQVKGRLPDSFSELQVGSGFDSTPGLPPGMKYQIDPKDRTVKIVRK